jgi:hypothetical protein
VACWQPGPAPTAPRPRSSAWALCGSRHGLPQRPVRSRAELAAPLLELLPPSTPLARCPALSAPPLTPAPPHPARPRPTPADHMQVGPPCVRWRSFTTPDLWRALAGFPEAEYRRAGHAPLATRLPITYMWAASLPRPSSPPPAFSL